MAESTQEIGFVPIIDLAPFLQGQAEGKLRVARAVSEACTMSGFLVVAGHGVSRATIDDMQRRSRQFFGLTEDEKRRYVAEEGQTGGYRPLRSSKLSRSIDQDSPPDLAEFYSMTRTGGEFDTDVWPAGLEGFRDAWLAYYAAMEDLAASIMRVFALALDLDERWFDDKIDEHISVLFANHYPSQPVAPEPGQLRLGPHTDFGSLTILYQDDAPGGLQVRTPDGDWEDVPFIPETYVVNIGDLMARWTNDRWVSTMHRVVNPPRETAQRDRLSLPFFHQPNEDAVIDCIPTCVEPGDPCRYEPVTSGAWRAMKVAKARY